MPVYAVRRIEDKEFFGLIRATEAELFHKVDEEADPYGFEYSTTNFKHCNGKNIAWLRFDRSISLIKPQKLILE